MKIAQMSKEKIILAFCSQGKLKKTAGILNRIVPRCDPMWLNMLPDGLELVQGRVVQVQEGTQANIFSLKLQD